MACAAAGALLACAALSLLAPAEAAEPRGMASKPRPVAPGAVRTIGWDELLPKDWNPGAEFSAADLSRLSDKDPRAAVLLKRLRQVWDNAPSNPAMNGAVVRIPGYVVPLEAAADGVREFLLVPYFGACIHSPAPPANQIIHVLAKVPMKALSAMDTVWISGAIKALRSDTSMGVGGYRVEEAQVERYAGRR